MKKISDIPIESVPQEAMDLNQYLPPTTPHLPQPEVSDIPSLAADVMDTQPLMVPQTPGLLPPVTPAPPTPMPMDGDMPHLPVDQVS